MISKVLSFVIGAFMVSGTPSRAAPAAAQELRELLAASRGVAPSLCSLAADGLSSWGGRWQAPAEAIQSDVRKRVHVERRQRLASDEAGALMQGLASADACERHISATLIGRLSDTTIVASLLPRVAAGSAAERQSVLIALGMLETPSALPAITRALTPRGRWVVSTSGVRCRRWRRRQATAMRPCALRPSFRLGSSMARIRSRRSFEY